MNKIQQMLTGRLGYIFGFLACFGLVGLALTIQVQYDLEPCPLCISQRMVFMGLGVLFLIASFVKPSTILSKLFTVLQLITALGGAGVAIRHWYIQVHKEEMIADCGVGFDYMFENFPFRKAINLVFKGTGDCASIDWTFLGLTIPQLSLISFVLMAGYAIYLVKLNQQR